MSKRSGLSRIEDLKRGFIDIGRFRYMLRKHDMEPWRNRTCPICNFGFGKEPSYYFMSYAIHNDCSFTPAFEKWAEEFYDEEIPSVDEDIS